MSHNNPTERLPYSFQDYVRNVIPRDGVRSGGENLQHDAPYHHAHLPQHPPHHGQHSHQHNHHPQQQIPDMTRNFKLLNDPAITHSFTKVYRYDGMMPGDKEPIEVSDPRSRLTRYSIKRNPIDLIYPDFKVDANYNLPIRPKEVTFSNINNNVNKTFLLEMCQNFGIVQDCNIYYHPINKKHLGLATVLFSTSSAAQRCVEKLNNTSSMGYIINVILDDKGQEKDRMYNEIIKDPKKSEFHPPAPVTKLPKEVMVSSSFPGRLPAFHASSAAIVTHPTVTAATTYTASASSMMKLPDKMLPAVKHQQPYTKSPANKFPTQGQHQQSAAAAVKSAEKCSEPYSNSWAKDIDKLFGLLKNSTAQPAAASNNFESNNTQSADSLAQQTTYNQQLQHQQNILSPSNQQSNKSALRDPRAQQPPQQQQNLMKQSQQQQQTTQNSAYMQQHSHDSFSKPSSNVSLSNRNESSRRGHRFNSDGCDSRYNDSNNSRYGNRARSSHYNRYNQNDYYSSSYDKRYNSNYNNKHGNNNGSWRKAQLGGNESDENNNANDSGKKRYLSPNTKRYHTYRAGRREDGDEYDDGGNRHKYPKNTYYKKSRYKDSRDYGDEEEDSSLEGINRPNENSKSSNRDSKIQQQLRNSTNNNNDNSSNYGFNYTDNVNILSKNSDDNSAYHSNELESTASSTAVPMTSSHASVITSTNLLTNADDNAVDSLEFNADAADSKNDSAGEGHEHFDSLESRIQALLGQQQLPSFSFPPPLPSSSAVEAATPADVASSKPAELEPAVDHPPLPLSLVPPLLPPDNLEPPMLVPPPHMQHASAASHFFHPHLPHPLHPHHHLPPPLPPPPLHAPPYLVPNFGYYPPYIGQQPVPWQPPPINEITGKEALKIHEQSHKQQEQQHLQCVFQKQREEQEEMDEKEKKEIERVKFEAVFDELASQLKEVVVRDCQKKMIELTGFKNYELWWDKHKQSTNVKQSLSGTDVRDEQLKKLTTSAAASTTSNSTVGTTTATANVTSSSVAMDTLSGLFDRSGLMAGGLLGMKSTRRLPAMPSFRRKTEPINEKREMAKSSDDDSEKDDDDDEDVVDDDDAHCERDDILDKMMKKKPALQLKGPRTPEASDDENSVADGDDDYYFQQKPPSPPTPPTSPDSKTAANLLKPKKINKTKTSAISNDASKKSHKKPKVKNKSKRKPNCKSLARIYSSSSSLSSSSLSSADSGDDDEDAENGAAENREKVILKNSIIKPGQNNAANINSAGYEDDDDDDDDDVSVGGDDDVRLLLAKSQSAKKISSAVYSSDEDVDDDKENDGDDDEEEEDVVVDDKMSDDNKKANRKLLSSFSSLSSLTKSEDDADVDVTGDGSDKRNKLKKVNSYNNNSSNNNNVNNSNNSVTKKLLPKDRLVKKRLPIAKKVPSSKQQQQHKKKKDLTYKGSAAVFKSRESFNSDKDGNRNVVLEKLDDDRNEAINVESVDNDDLDGEDSRCAADDKMVINVVDDETKPLDVVGVEKNKSKISHIPNELTNLASLSNDVRNDMYKIDDELNEDIDNLGLLSSVASNVQKQNEKMFNRNIANNSNSRSLKMDSGTTDSLNSFSYGGDGEVLPTAISRRDLMEPVVSDFAQVDLETLIPRHFIHARQTNDNKINKKLTTPSKESVTSKIPTTTTTTTTTITSVVKELKDHDYAKNWWQEVKPRKGRKPKRKPQSEHLSDNERNNKLFFSSGEETIFADIETLDDCDIASESNIKTSLKNNSKAGNVETRMLKSILEEHLYSAPRIEDLLKLKHSSKDKVSGEDYFYGDDDDDERDDEDSNLLHHQAKVYVKVSEADDIFGEIHENNGNLITINNEKYMLEKVPLICREVDIDNNIGKNNDVHDDVDDEREEGEYRSSDENNEMNIEDDDDDDEDRMVIDEGDDVVTKAKIAKKLKRHVSISSQLSFTNVSKKIKLDSKKQAKIKKPGHKFKCSRELANLLSEAVAVTAMKSKQFSRRDFKEETRVLYSIVMEGIDLEDSEFLRLQYEKIVEHLAGGKADAASNPIWVYNVRWVDHPSIIDPYYDGKFMNSRKMMKKEMFDVHKTGSARTEGYCKVSHQTKQYLKQAHGIENSQSHHRDNDLTPLVTSSSLSSTSSSLQLAALTSVSTSSLLSTEASLESVMRKRAQQNREARSEGRRWQNLLTTNLGEDRAELLKFNQLKLRKKQLKFARSRIHDWGLFALEPIAEGELVIEYTGQVIRQTVADLREKRYEADGIGSSYLFRIDAQTIIDATKFGNLSRFVNHCCNPNCYAKIVSLDGFKRIVIYSRRDIDVNEEITYDYKFPIEDDKIPCLCGAHNCRGTLN